jgi:hypothetical protein
MHCLRASRGVGSVMAVVVVVLLVAPLSAQEAPPATKPGPAAGSSGSSDPLPAQVSPSAPVTSGQLPGYVPITSRQRVDWAVGSTVGPTAWASGLLATTWYSAWRSPKEWKGFSGSGKRLLDHQASAAVSNVMEAGLGAFWGEDPRYPRSVDRHVAARVRNVLNDTLTAPYRDGRRRFAWARLIAAVGNNAVEDSWLPPSSRTWQSTLRRAGYAYLAHMAVDAFDEFWPDLWKWLRRKTARRPPVSGSVSAPNTNETREFEARRASAILDRFVTVW